MEDGYIRPGEIARVRLPYRSEAWKVDCAHCCGLGNVAIVRLPTGSQGKKLTNFQQAPKKVSNRFTR